MTAIVNKTALTKKVISQAIYLLHFMLNRGLSNKILGVYQKNDLTLSSYRSAWEGLRFLWMILCIFFIWKCFSSVLAIVLLSWSRFLASLICCFVGRFLSSRMVPASIRPCHPWQVLLSGEYGAVVNKYFINHCWQMPLKTSKAVFLVWVLFNSPESSEF